VSADATRSLAEMLDDTEPCPGKGAGGSAPPSDLRDELVGPGRYPLRIQPAAALLPGRADPARLVAVWFARKSFYWMLFLGLAIGVLVDRTLGNDAHVELGVSPGQLTDLFQPYALAVLALLVRLLSAWVALALAFPLALAHEPGLSPRRPFAMGKLVDRIHVARAFRALRWTQDVRELALRRLEAAGWRLRRLDPMLTWANLASFALLVVVVMSFGAAIRAR
jgi:hypothetical protein